MATLVYMELLKLVKRPMTWVLFVLLHGLIGLGTVVGMLNLHSVDPATQEGLARDLTLPGILPVTTQLIAVFGSLMLVILAASAIGSEYSWGTLRPLLATGLSRTRFLGAKILALALVVAVFVVLPLIMNAILAVPAALLGERPVFSGTLDVAWLGHFAALVGRTYVLVAMPVALAFLMGLVGRSQAAGIGVALGVTIGEQIVGMVLLGLDLGWSHAIGAFLPFLSSQSLQGRNREPPQIEPGMLGEGRALLTLLGYSVVCVVIALLIFRRRDVRGSA